ncbi:hypothetical protein HDU97_006914 [Phlyctochytrium planicorne]|nr:hypothetical protein HDU97_006914 [Phlyctochytrium planicorne]
MGRLSRELRMEMPSLLEPVLNRLRANVPPPDDIHNHHPSSRAAVLVLLSSHSNSNPSSNPASSLSATSSTELHSIFPEVDTNPEWNLRVYLTKRSSNLRTHGGEVALPGGKKDEQDKDLVETALREAQEEIGLPSDFVNVLTTFESASSKHNLLVTPVVGLLKNPFTPSANPSEVESVFTVPLARFLDSRGHKSMLFPKSSGDGFWKAHWFDWVDHQTGMEYIIFGLTASILIKIASVAFNRQPDFEIIRPQDRPNSVKSFHETLAHKDVKSDETKGGAAETKHSKM